MVGVHLEDAADALLLVRRRVVDGRAGVELAGVDAEVRELADERIAHHLEGEGGERCGQRGLARLGLARARDGALDRRDVERARQVRDHGVEHLLDALVLERGAAEQRRDRQVERGGADRGDEVSVVDRLILEERHHDVLVVVRDGLDERVAGQLGLGQQVALGVGLAPGKALLVLIERDGLHADEIDDALEVLLGTDRDLDRHRVGAEAVDDRRAHVLEVGANAVHLVDERDARHGVLIGLTPHGLGLRLDAGDRVEHGDGAIEHAQGALHLDGEVHVPGCIDDVDAMTAPQRRRGRRGDRDAALLLLDHPVHRRATLVDLAQLVGAARVEEDALGDGRLARVNVGHDADVPVQVELVGARGGGLGLGVDDSAHTDYQR